MTDEPRPGVYNPAVQHLKLTRGTQLDAQGRVICVHCGTVIEHASPKSNRRWHRACVQDHQVRSHYGALRASVFARDRGVCALCGIDTVALRDAIKRVRDGRSEYVSLTDAEKEEQAQRFKLPVAELFRRARWEADHVVPKAEGGDYTGLDNLRTLCGVCHASETGRLRKRLNAARKAREGES